jgi:hypothetical protein
MTWVRLRGRSGEPSALVTTCQLSSVRTPSRSSSSACATRQRRADGDVEVQPIAEFLRRSRWRPPTEVSLLRRFFSIYASGDREMPALRTESAALIVENLLNVEQAALSGLGRSGCPIFLDGRFR